LKRYASFSQGCTHRYYITAFQALLFYFTQRHEGAKEEDILTLHFVVIGKDAKEKRRTDPHRHAEFISASSCVNLRGDISGRC